MEWALIVVVLVVLVGVIVAWHTTKYGYRCSSCGHDFEISFLRNLTSPHVPTEDGGQKYLRCPGCNEKAWARIVVKTEGSAS